MTNQINPTNAPTRAGELAGPRETFGERFAVYPIHTRFDAVQWFVEDLQKVDVSDLAIVGQHGSRGDAVVQTYELLGIELTDNSAEELEGSLLRYDDGEFLRSATRKELDASREAARSDGGAGVIEVDGERCYVIED